MKMFFYSNQIVHRPNVAYSPWINLTVERLNGDVLAAIRSTLMEMKLAPHDWDKVLPIIASALNADPLSRLGNMMIDLRGHLCRL